MKFSASLFLLASCCIIAGSGAARDATTGETKASERHAQLRKLQPQSCAKGSSSLVGNGSVRLVKLHATVEFSAHICFDEDSGVAVGEFFDSASEDTHVTYHVHCDARDDTGGIYFGTEIDHMSEAVLEGLASPTRDESTTGRKLAKVKSEKGTRSPKATKSPKSSKACGCDACPNIDCKSFSPQVDDCIVPKCPPDTGTIDCCLCGGRKLQEDTGMMLQHANGEAKKNRELSSNTPQGTLALLYFGTNGEGKEGKTTDMFGLHLFADFDLSCESFAEEMKDFNMDEDIAHFKSGGFSIHHF